MKTTMRLFISFLLLSTIQYINGQELDWEYGRNDFYLEHEDVQRHFIVHVPQLYDGGEEVPVVFMFHGTNGQGHSMWLNSRWPQLCEEENFITVFPSSWKYLLTTTDAVNEKWNFSHLYEITAEIDSLKDDVGFIDKVLDRVIESFNVDERRIYASGFSNGSSFVHTRIIPEMNDRFAAATGIAGFLKFEFDIEGILMPAITTVGTKDGKILDVHPDTILPFNVQGILDDPAFGKFIDSSLFSLRLAKEYTVDSTFEAITFHFNTSLEDDDNEWHFSVLNRVAHVYPNGGNNPLGLTVAPQYWEFFKQFQLQDESTSVVETEENLPFVFSSIIDSDILSLTLLNQSNVDEWSVLISDRNGNAFREFTILDEPLYIGDLPFGLYILTFIRDGKPVSSCKVIKL